MLSTENSIFRFGFTTFNHMNLEFENLQINQYASGYENNIFKRREKNPIFHTVINMIFFQKQKEKP